MTPLAQMYLVFKIQFWIGVVGIPIYLMSVAVLDYPKVKEPTQRWHDVLRVAIAVPSSIYLYWLIWGHS